MRRRTYIPISCDVCGATVPHDNPMSLQFHDQRARIQVDRQEEKPLFDEAVARAQALGRPFEDYEVFQPAWDAGIEIVPQMDSRFILIKEATRTSRRLWGLRSQEGQSNDGNT
jgi:hypothetical protein